MEEDRLAFYSNSRDAAPGKGAREWVKDASLYAELASIRQWRSVLSNFHVCPFKYLDGHMYNSIEHVFQAIKISFVDAKKAHWFTLDSGHAIGQGDGAMAQKNRKIAILSREQLAKWDAMKDEVMKDAAICKYNSCENAQRVLRVTGKAQLWHIMSRKNPVRFTHLENIRQWLID
jgi:predicted NAD-dependent protein-ADP-ribosyltransferase YbiA (DUF1768 family)